MIMRTNCGCLSQSSVVGAYLVLGLRISEETQCERQIGLKSEEAGRVGWPGYLHYPPCRDSHSEGWVIYYHVLADD